MTEYKKLDDSQLIEKFKNGESGVADYIMNKYKPMVLKKARAMFLLGGESEDLIQEGMIGLFKALRDYDKSQKTAFSTFADLCVSRQMSTAVTASNRDKHTPLNTYTSLYESTEQKEGQKSIPLIEQLPPVQETNPEALLIQKEKMEILYTELRKLLSVFERKVLQLFLQGEDYQSIAQILGKTPKAIDNALQRIKKKVFDIPSDVL